MTLRSLDMRRFPPWLRTVLTLYLLGTLFLVAVHQHHDATQAHDCALCALAHTPAVVASATLQPVHGGAAQYLPAAPEVRGWDSELSRAPHSRATPLT